MPVVLAIATASALAACTSDGADDAADGATSDAPVAATAPSTPVATTIPPATSTSTSTTSTITTTTTPPRTTTTTIAIPDAPGPLDLSAAVVGLGRSVEGRPIVAERYGTPGGRRVLVIGVIHGDEDAGTAILDDLRSAPVPDGVELWLVDSMNPDGQAAQVRQNANGVDLNRNFPDSWGPIGVPGDSQYAGTGPASEPETQAIVNLVDQLRPDITIWYHQDLFVISPAKGREGRIRQRYAELTELADGRDLRRHVHRHRRDVGPPRARRPGRCRLHRRTRPDPVAGGRRPARRRHPHDRRRRLKRLGSGTERFRFRRSGRRPRVARGRRRAS